MIEKNPKLKTKKEGNGCHTTALITPLIWVHSRDVMIEKKQK